jgi:hypothetical protein
LPRKDDTPYGVWAETGGPGDDLCIDFGSRLVKAEVQAKFNLTAGERLKEVVQEIGSRMIPGKEMPVLLAVDGNTSKKIRVHLARDLDRIHMGRFDGLKAETESLRTLKGADKTLGMLHVVTVDIEEESGSHAQNMLRMLEACLNEKAAAPSTIAALFQDATDLCEHRQARTRTEIVDLLKSKGIQVRSLRAEEDRLLDVSRDLVNSYYLDAAITVLDVSPE